jgi:hypothetical protein
MTGHEETVEGELFDAACEGSPRRLLGRVGLDADVHGAHHVRNGR